MPASDDEMIQRQAMLDAIAKAAEGRKIQDAVERAVTGRAVTQAFLVRIEGGPENGKTFMSEWTEIDQLPKTFKMGGALYERGMFSKLPPMDYVVRGAVYHWKGGPDDSHYGTRSVDLIKALAVRVDEHGLEITTERRD